MSKTNGNQRELTLYNSIQGQILIKLSCGKLIKSNMESCRTVTDNTNIILNCDISYVEVEHQVNKSKINKSVGSDLIPNEVLQHPDYIMVLFLFI